MHTFCHRVSVRTLVAECRQQSRPGGQRCRALICSSGISISRKTLKELFGIACRSARRSFLVSGLYKFPQTRTPGTPATTTRDGANLFAVEARQREGKRYLMPNDQSMRRFSAPFIEGKSVPQRHHEGEQEQGDGYAQHRQDATPLFTEHVLGHR